MLTLSPVQLLIALLGTGSVTTLITYWLARPKNRAESRKLNAEAFQGEVEGVKALVNMWKESNQDLINSNTKLLDEVIGLRKEVGELQREVHKLRQENLVLKNGATS